LKLIRTSKIREVWIDCQKGLDVPAVEEPTPQAPAVQLPVEPLAEWPGELDPVETSIELRRASRLRGQAKTAMQNIFNDTRLGNAVNVESVQVLVDDIADSVTRNTGAFISLARLKSADEYLYLHSVTVCALMMGLARQMGWDGAAVRAAGTAGLLHDIGKSAISLEILNKPGTLTPQEFEVVKGHPRAGHQMLLDSGVTDTGLLAACLQHHERTKGGGYPAGLLDAQIDPLAKMTSVCDVYDAVTSNRPYKEGWDPAESLKHMATWAPGRFDPTIFQAFVKSIGVYPIGSLVRMASGRLGVVVEQTPRSLTTPLVRVFFSVNSGYRIAPELLDLSAPGTLDKILAREDHKHWNFPDLNEIWSGLPGIG